MDHTNVRRQLERVVDAFDAVITERGWAQPPLLLRIEGKLGPDGSFDLGVRELDGHPAEVLLGFSAPLAWTAIGVSTEGWATPYGEHPRDDGAEVGAGSSGVRVRVLILLSRGGDRLGRICWEDGRCLPEAPGEGLVVDCLRRALGRPTPPPTATTDLLFATMWLENVLARSREARQPLTWGQAAALHPAMQVMAADAPALQHDDVVGPMRALAKVCDWSIVRQQVMRGWQAGLEPFLAEWMDAGMVSRWLLDRRPGIEELLGELARVCAPPVLRQIRPSLIGLGITEPRLIRQDSHESLERWFPVLLASWSQCPGPVPLRSARSPLSHPNVRMEGAYNPITRGTHSGYLVARHSGN